jgi:hypothetical protein
VIKLTDTNGLDVYLAERSVTSIREAPTSSQWHGVKSFVRTDEGNLIECQQDAKQIANMLLDNYRIEDFRERCIDLVARHGGSVEIEAAIRAEPAFRTRD